MNGKKLVKTSIFSNLPLLVLSGAFMGYTCYQISEINRLPNNDDFGVQEGAALYVVFAVFVGLYMLPVLLNLLFKTVRLLVKKRVMGLFCILFDTILVFSGLLWTYISVSDLKRGLSGFVPVIVALLFVLPAAVSFVANVASMFAEYE